MEPKTNAQKIVSNTSETKFTGKGAHTVLSQFTNLGAKTDTLMKLSTPTALYKGDSLFWYFKYGCFNNKH